MEGADLHKYYGIECRNHQYLRRPDLYTETKIHGIEIPIR